MLLQQKPNMIVLNRVMGDAKNLPPELVDRINNSRRRCFSNSGMMKPDRYSSSIYSGGWVPYATLTRKPTPNRFGSEMPITTTSVSGNPSVVHTTENAHWLSRNSVSAIKMSKFSNKLVFLRAFLRFPSKHARNFGLFNDVLIFRSDPLKRLRG